MTRGALIVVEGLDRSGKSSQCVRLVERLREEGFQAEAMRFPNRATPIGTMIDAYLQQKSELDDHAIHLLFSANRWEQRQAMIDKLESGMSLIVDRYVYSGIAFSAAKGLDINWCRACDMGLPQPDGVLFLDITLEEAAKRGGYGQERYEKEAMQRATARSFAVLQASPTEEWHIIDASLTRDEVHEALLAKTKSILSDIKSNSRPLGVIES